MSSSATPARRRRAVLVGSLVLACVGALGPAPSAVADPATLPDVPDPRTASSTTGDYIVTLTEAPIAAYDGEVEGYPATTPDPGESVDTDTRAARRYRGYLHDRQDAVAARVGVTPRERFDVGLAAFTTRMTRQQAANLSRTGGVAAVTEDRLRPVRDDSSSTDALGLSGEHGVWERLGGPERAGRGVVVGVLDSGVWPESASFAGEPLTSASSAATKRHRDRYRPTRIGDTITMTKSDGGVFTGTCETGEEFTLDDCSSKLVGARTFGETWLSKVPAERRADYVSPRDGDGHGSHTASIAAGNAGVTATAGGRELGTISGVAPAARIAAYKVLWHAADAAESGAYDSDVLDAIDAAISDGVDVINFSVSAEDDPTAPVQLAFLAAASAGIFVAASAGNSGPDAGTVQSTAPWVTTVGAHTIAPQYGTVTLGDGRRYAGVSVTVDEPVGPVPLVAGAAAAAPTATATAAAACAPDSLDPAAVAGAVVVCARGVVERTVKSAEVARAGGVGMVLANATADTLDADLHSVPTVHLDPPGAAAVTAYASTPGATATLTDGNATDTAIVSPQLASFSGRGPSTGSGGDTLKPDLVAPGVSILGATAPVDGRGEFAYVSGTSQSAPQVAGLAALWFGQGVRPTWSPMQIKSALMTTAGDLLQADGSRLTDPYAQGAGRVRPDLMLEPGLVYPAGDRDWLAYLKGLGLDTGAGVAAIDPSDYNAPSIAIGRLVGRQTVTRRVTSVTAGTYQVAAAIPGVDVDVSPSVLRFTRAGQTKSFTVTLTRTSATFDRPASGFLTWRGTGTRVRIPLVVTPRRLDAPARITGSGASGTVDYRVVPGESGLFTATATGLVAGPARGGPAQPLPQGQNLQYAVAVPADTRAARFTVRAADSAAGLQLYLYRVVNGAAVLVSQATTVAASQSLVLARPAAGTYVVLVYNARNAPGTTATVFEQRSALVVAGGAGGSLAVRPGSVQAQAGRPIELSASWSGLQPDVPSVGWVEYPNGAGTVVVVN